MFFRKNYLARLSKISDISSPYIPTDTSKFDENKLQMGKELQEIEEGIDDWTYELHEKYSMALNNYCSWYVRGEERKPLLENVVYHLEESLKLNNSSSVKTEIARILIEEKVVRNLDKALIYVNEIIEVGELPSWMNSIVEKAKRWNGEIDIPQEIDLSNLEPSPAVLCEERTKLRYLLKTLIKQNDCRKEIVALKLYNLGLLTTALYRDHDCNSGVSGFDFDNAIKKAKKIAKKINYKYMGRISNCTFLSESDYKKLDEVLGKNTSIIDVDDLIR